MSLQDIRYWFEDLELREKLAENQGLVSIGIVFVIVTCLGLIVYQLTGWGGGPAYGKAEHVYYDLTNQKILIVEQTQSRGATSPLEGTTDVFRATVYACEECPRGKIKDGMTLDQLKAAGMFIGWIKQIDPSVSNEMTMFGEGYSYRSLESDRWYRPTEKGYESLMKRVNSRCNKVRICLP